MAFGSCNKQDKQNLLWEAVLKNNPDIWIWGGDNIYSDTDNMKKMRRDYEQQRQQKGYTALANSVTVMGTWDDHDYGINDGGVEFHKKKESQHLFLDFLNAPKNDERRNRAGIYYARSYTTQSGSVKIIVLDTRYFRTGLTKASDRKKRYQPNAYGDGTILGKAQWDWLKQELEHSKADFNIIVSSIQVLSNQHGFETWGNFPHEVDKLKALIRTTKAKGVVLLSGDRHLSEFSVTGVEGLLYPLIDFTSSGLTHAYTKYTSEPNPYRMGKVVSQISFGLLKINFKTKSIVMQMRGAGNVVLQEYIQVYP
ncbi:MAG: alkaline phosphatase D family protein [Bacteroidota bacterium]